jgi:hypothetical protein
VQDIKKEAKAHRKEASEKKRKFRRQWQRSTWIMDKKWSTNFDDHILYLDLCIKFIIWCTTLHIWRIVTWEYNLYHYLWTVKCNDCAGEYTPLYWITRKKRKNNCRSTPRSTLKKIIANNETN